MNETILEVEHLRKTFGGIVAVDDASFDVKEGTVTGLIGPNGAGKTTTFNLISGLYEPDSGVVRLNGTDIQQIMQPDRAEKGIWIGSSGLVFGGVGGLAASTAGFSSPALGAATIAGIGVGAGLYLGQEAVKTRCLDTKHTRPFQIARAGLARTFQITRELKEMTVLENMMLAPKGQSGENLFNAVFRREDWQSQESAIRARALEFLELLEIDHLQDEKAVNLSGGQRKLLELGRVLMLDPEIILLDEPVAGVNPTLSQKLLERIQDLREEGYTFLIIEHDMDVIMTISDTIIVMEEGRKLTEGAPEDIKTDERVIDAYLGGN